jgi:hypothetical protein
VADGLRGELREKQQKLDQAQGKLEETQKMAESLKNEWDWRVADFETRQREWEREGEVWAETQRQWQREREDLLVEKREWEGERQRMEVQAAEHARNAEARAQARERERGTSELKGQGGGGGAEREEDGGGEERLCEWQKKRKLDGIHSSGLERSIEGDREEKEEVRVSGDGRERTWGSGQWEAFLSRGVEAHDGGDGAGAGAGGMAGGEHSGLGASCVSEASDKDSHVLDTERDASVDESFSSSSLDGSLLARLLGEDTPAVNEAGTDGANVSEVFPQHVFPLHACSYTASSSRSLSLPCSPNTDACTL